jgi:hypothetical protein
MVLLKGTAEKAVPLTFPARTFDPPLRFSNQSFPKYWVKNKEGNCRPSRSI